jgi:hypothetical protein
VWKSTVEGQTLHFRLAGINNQNFIMQDDETGTWWQQVSGEAILGPLKGKRLDAIEWDEVSFGLWKHEHPQGVVLKDDEKQRKHYAEEDWEKRILKRPTVTTHQADDPLKPRDLVLGVEWNGIAKAYPFETLKRQNPVMDTLGNLPLLIVVDIDGKSLRCFDRGVDGKPHDFFLRPSQNPLTLFDSQTGSEWDFSGTAVSGTMKGKTLRRIPALNDFWFDWKIYHPLTKVYVGT